MTPMVTPIRRRPKVKRARVAELPQPEVMDVVVEDEGRNPELEALLLRMAELKADAKAFAEVNGPAFASAEGKAIDLMKVLGIERYDSPDVSGVYVEAQTPVIDWDAIQREVPTDVWDGLTTRAGDKAKLDAWLKSKDARGVEWGKTALGKRVRKHITSKSSKPYVKATRKVVTP